MPKLREMMGRSKPLKYFEKNVVFYTILEQMFKRMNTNLNTELTMMQERMT
jgi:hypothetical protein